MAADTMTSPPSIASHIVVGGESGAVNGSELPLQDEGDNRSSSLSDLGERAGHDEAEEDFGESSDGNDTEAETERLEESPPKNRRQENIVLTTANNLYGERQGQMSLPVTRGTPRILGTDRTRQNDLEKGEIEPTSEISSVAESIEGHNDLLTTTPLSPRKRKLSSVEHNSLGEQESLEEPPAKSTKIFGPSSVGTLSGSSSPNGSVAEEDDEGEQEPSVDTAIIRISGIRQDGSPDHVVSQQEELKQGNRPSRSMHIDTPEPIDHGTRNRMTPARHMEDHETASSNDEGENDDTGDALEAENAVKVEEGSQKKTALNALNAMEKCFATLRDKLFDERLAQCNEELAMLESSMPTHPELLAMKKVIDQRRDQKIRYEQNLMKYKLQTLERESIANKAQALSQYMQTAREVRDAYLEKVNEKCYQLQRERRNAEEDVPDYLFTFPAKRSKQIMQQSAYNSEVSILSGIAKYVGFPAAPEIRVARPKEIEDDLRSMGISTQVPQPVQRQPPLLRPMASSGFSRRRSGADEHFLEQNPWANPQHPSHQHRQQLHRQMSAQSRTATPSSTQRRPANLSEPQRSASTIADHPSGSNPSIAATPAMGESSRPSRSGQSYPPKRRIEDSTANRIGGNPREDSTIATAPQEVLTKEAQPVQPIKAGRTNSPPRFMNRSRNSQTPNTIPKPLPFTNNSGATSIPVPRTSTPGRYAAIKHEDHGHLSRKSPLPRYDTSPINAVLSGSSSKFTA